MLTPFSLLTHSTPLSSLFCFLSIVPADRGWGEHVAGGNDTRKERKEDLAERKGNPRDVEGVDDDKKRETGKEGDSDGGNIVSNKNSESSVSEKE